MSARPLTYLACPYSSEDPEVMRERFAAVNRAAARLMASGNIVYSPISHSHPIAEQCDLPRDWEHWCHIDCAYLDCSRLLVVLRLRGWSESCGVRAEMEYARETGIPVVYMDPVG